MKSTLVNLVLHGSTCFGNRFQWDSSVPTNQNHKVNHEISTRKRARDSWVASRKKQPLIVGCLGFEMVHMSLDSIPRSRSISSGSSAQFGPQFLPGIVFWQGRYISCGQENFRIWQNTCNEKHMPNSAHFFKNLKQLWPFHLNILYDFTWELWKFRGCPALESPHYSFFEPVCRFVSAISDLKLNMPWRDIGNMYIYINMISKHDFPYLGGMTLCWCEGTSLDGTQLGQNGQWVVAIWKACGSKDSCKKKAQWSRLPRGLPQQLREACW